MSDHKQAQVGQNSHVEIALIDEQNNSEPMEFDLVADGAADFDRGRIEVSTPLGKAIRGKFVGSVVPYTMGDIRQVRIIRVRPLEEKIIEDVTERRQSILDEALRRAERTNADMFASSFSGKWGNYNTDEVDDMNNE